jgi:hypothetical protein
MDGVGLGRGRGRQFEKQGDHTVEVGSHLLNTSEGGFERDKLGGLIVVGAFITFGFDADD